MPKKSNPPSISELSFDCPHCGTFTSHTWLQTYAKKVQTDNRTPHRILPSNLPRLQSNTTLEEEEKKSLIAYAERILSGLVFIETRKSEYFNESVANLNLSVCYACEKIAVWVHERLIFPTAMEAELPNPDLPEDVRRDYEEAGRILNESPRGAAALLRLAIQKLCMFLGEKGKKIDDDIASLVKKGLLPQVQQALDAVRVIGNEAVHPGTMALKDDRDTASGLFELVNIIADQMISHPKQTQATFDKLPASKKKGIEQRDIKP